MHWRKCASICTQRCRHIVQQNGAEWSLWQPCRYTYTVDAIPRAAPGCVHASPGADGALHACLRLREWLKKTSTEFCVIRTFFLPSISPQSPTFSMLHSLHFHFSSFLDPPPPPPPQQKTKPRKHMRVTLAKKIETATQAKLGVVDKKKKVGSMWIF